MTTDIEAIGKDIVDAAYKVHKEFGPGLLESATASVMGSFYRPRLQTPPFGGDAAHRSTRQLYLC